MESEPEVEKDYDIAKKERCFWSRSQLARLHGILTATNVAAMLEITGASKEVINNSAWMFALSIPLNCYAWMIYSGHYGENTFKDRGKISNFYPSIILGMGFMTTVFGLIAVAFYLSVPAGIVFIAMMMFLVLFGNNLDMRTN